MTRMERYAVVIRLIEALRAKGSWCGETHIQKAAFLAQTMLNVPLGYQFILYKHGPYSFDLRDEITAMRADELIQLQPQIYPYGPTLNPTRHAANLQNIASGTAKRYGDKLQFVAAAFRDRNVSELERLSTAYYVARDSATGASVLARANRLVELKPHVPLDAAVDATKEIDKLVEKSHSKHVAA